MKTLFLFLFPLFSYTQQEKENFKSHWITFLSLIEQIGLEKLKMHKLYIYAFDLRPHLYTAIEDQSYIKEATLKDHCLFNNKYIGKKKCIQTH